MKIFKVFFLACLAIAVFAACASSSGATPSITLESTANVEVVEHKGTALGITTIPQWLSVYTLGGGTRGIENLPDYMDDYVFVGTANGAGLQQVQTWANNFDVQQQIGSTISTRVASVFKAHENLLPNDTEAVRKYDNALNTLVTATYTGARKIDDWWTHTRTTERGRTIDTRYTAYVLYTINRKVLDDQIRAQVLMLKNDNPELSAMFDAVAIQLLERGLEWE